MTDPRTEIDTDTQDETRSERVVLSRDLDAPPEKVWRAVSIPALRAQWLPEADLADGEPLSSVVGQEVRYRMRDGEPPFLESVVTLRLHPNADGGTRLTVIHRLADVRVLHGEMAANTNTNTNSNPNLKTGGLVLLAAA